MFFFRTTFFPCVRTLTWAAIVNALLLVAFSPSPLVFTRRRTMPKVHRSLYFNVGPLVYLGVEPNSRSCPVSGLLYRNQLSFSDDWLNRLDDGWGPISENSWLLQDGASISFTRGSSNRLDGLRSRGHFLYILYTFSIEKKGISNFWRR